MVIWMDEKVERPQTCPDYPFTPVELSESDIEESDVGRCMYSIHLLSYMTATQRAYESLENQG